MLSTRLTGLANERGRKGTCHGNGSLGDSRHLRLAPSPCGCTASAAALDAPFCAQQNAQLDKARLEKKAAQNVGSCKEAQRLCLQKMHVGRDMHAASVEQKSQHLFFFFQWVWNASILNSSRAAATWLDDGSGPVSMARRGVCSDGDASLSHNSDRLQRTKQGGVMRAGRARWRHAESSGTRAAFQVSETRYERRVGERLERDRITVGKARLRPQARQRRRGPGAPADRPSWIFPAHRCVRLVRNM